MRSSILSTWPPHIAAVEVVEEAVVNALDGAAEGMSTPKSAGKVCSAIVRGQPVEFVRRYNRCR